MTAYPHSVDGTMITDRHNSDHVSVLVPINSASCHCVSKQICVVFMISCVSSQFCYLSFDIEMLGGASGKSKLILYLCDFPGGE